MTTSQRITKITGTILIGKKDTYHDCKSIIQKDKDKIMKVEPKTDEIKDISDIEKISEAENGQSDVGNLAKIIAKTKSKRKQKAKVNSKESANIKIWNPKVIEIKIKVHHVAWITGVFLILNIMASAIVSVKVFSNLCFLSPGQAPKEQNLEN